MVKNLPAMQETWVQSLCQQDPLDKGLLPTPVFLPGEFHGQRRLVGYSPWGHKESDTTDRHFHFFEYLSLHCFECSLTEGIHLAHFLNFANIMLLQVSKRKTLPTEVGTKCQCKIIHIIDTICQRQCNLRHHL